MTHDVFISHSSKDKAVADAVCAALESAKIRCWIAPRDILGGEKWASAISKAISSSRIMVLIFSSHSNKSEDVLNELLLARDAGAIIIPFKIGDILPNGDMEYYLKRTHWLDAMDPPTEKQIQSLVETVEQFIKGSSSISKPDVKPRIEAVELEPHRKKQKIKEIFQNKYLVVAALFIVLILGYWALIPSDTASKIATPTVIQSQNFTLTASATPIITPSSDQKITSTPSATPIITPSFDKKTITNSFGMTFVQIPAGEFDMGSPSNEEGRNDDEGPIHRVKIAKAFYMGETEVTEKEWSEVMWVTPSSSLPVGGVSWDKVQEFIKTLNEKEKTQKYRLPSEAECEYAARAGTTTRYSFGDDESKLGVYAWFIENSGEKAHNVAAKKPNPWGLYDMHGNVYEMVQDIYQTDYNGAPVDGSSWEKNGPNRVIRGGSWSGNSFLCRSALRKKVPPDTPYSNVGFRLVKDL
jgi:formylglycine-generating enzyme required for sulfatase activity